MHVFQAFLAVVSAAKTSSAGRSFSGGKKNLLAIYSKGLCHKSFLQFATVLDFVSVSFTPYECSVPIIFVILAD